MERKKYESKESYHTRLKADQVSAKQRAKGRVVWDSQKQGTYVRAKHGPLR